MNIKLKYWVLVMLLLPNLLFAQQKKIKLIDVNATAETRNLYKNLFTLSRNHILFGHQHATEYGHGWRGDVDRSDVKSITGSHPAVIGVDFSGLSGYTETEIAKNKISLQKNISDTYNRGGITTVAWHFNNPITNTAFYWKDSVSAAAVQYIIPGGSYHEKYKTILQTIADVAKNTKGNDGNLVPMIFRPFHEFDGDWFWWGKSHCTKEAFTSLWQFTVTYLRDSLQVHNFIYAFSPDNNFTTEQTYLERFPGNEFVDIVGIDDYNDFGRYGKYTVDSGMMRLEIVHNYAIKSNKLAAFTETGLESIPNESWWTTVLLKAIKTKKLQFAYVLVWRNDVTSKTHFYAPYPGQVSEMDFIKFYNDPFTLFEHDLKNIYKK